MTDRSDELRDRLPEADRIRDRIREQREAGDDRFADTDDPDGYYKYELKNLKAGGPESVLDDGAGLKGPDSAAVFAKYDGFDGEGVKVGGPESVLDDGADLKGPDTAVAFVKYDGIDGESASSYLEIEEIPGESQRVVGADDAPDWLGEDTTLADDITGVDAPVAAVKAGDVADGGQIVVDHKSDDLKADGLKGVVDHRADDLKADGLKGVVDHRAGDLIDASATPDAISGDADWEIPLTTEDPVGDALDPLAEGDDISASFPDVELADAAGSLVDDIDLSDGI